MYKILIKDLKVTATHGILPEEKINPQEFLINMEATCPFIKDLAENDTLEERFCYGIMREKIINICMSNTFNTIEKLAYKINNELLNQCKDMISITTRIEKTKLLKDCRVGIQLTTRKEN